MSKGYLTTLPISLTSAHATITSNGFSKLILQISQRQRWSPATVLKQRPEGFPSTWSCPPRSSCHSGCSCRAAATTRRPTPSAFRRNRSTATPAVSQRSGNQRWTTPGWSYSEIMVNCHSLLNKKWRFSHRWGWTRCWFSHNHLTSWRLIIFN